MPMISVVIRSLNEEKHVARLLKGIKKQTVQPDEIILVDSGSKDRTVEIARSFGMKIVTIAPERFSFGRALNLGIQHAAGDIIIIPSAHVYPVYDTWIEELVAPFENPAIVLTYGRQIGDENTKYSENQIFGKWFPAQSAIPQNHPFCNNANAAIRRSVWAGIPYDEELTGLEDLAWAKRAMQQGHQVAYVAEATIVHVHAESWRQVQNRYRREAIAHKVIYGDQRFSGWDTLVLLAGNLLSDYYHAAREGVFVRNLLDIFRFRWAQFWGTYRGFRHQGPVSSTLKRRFYYPNGVREDLRAPAAGQRGRFIEY